MFTADTVIDTVQNGKKQFVKTFVMREASKFDYAKFGEGIMKAYQATGKAK